LVTLRTPPALSEALKAAPDGTNEVRFWTWMFLVVPSGLMAVSLTSTTTRRSSPAGTDSDW
jgi:hypothetical protein